MWSSSVTPSNHQTFDPWNTSSTGHQVSETPSSSITSWRRIRAAKLAHQFDPPRQPQSVQKSQSKGAEVWKWVPEPEATRHQLGCRDIRSYLGVRKRPRPRLESGGDDADGTGEKKRIRQAETNNNEQQKEPGMGDGERGVLVDGGARHRLDSGGPGSGDPTPKKGIFTGTTVYVNGSTLPLISDHRLKHLLVTGGATLALSLERKSVTHVIVGRPCSGPAGSGGGLAGGKLNREIERAGGQVKVVNADWCAFYLPSHVAFGVWLAGWLTDCSGSWSRIKRLNAFLKQTLL